MRIDYKSIVCIASDILKLAVSKEYYYRIDWNARILLQTLSDGLYMSSILHYRIVKTVLLLSICQYLCPIFLMFVAKNPATIVFYFEYNNASFCWDGYINLRVLTI